MKKAMLSFVIPFVIMAVVTIFAYNMDNMLYTDSGTDVVYADPPGDGVGADVSGMFNERGYYKSNSVSFDENEIISDFNGNLSYSFPMFNMKGPGDMYIDFSLNYNGSIGYKAYPNGGEAASWNGFAETSVTAPGWVLSLNGMAVQMTNFEVNFLSQPHNNGATINSNRVNLLAQGYHVSGGFTLPTSVNKDNIILMLGDGSTVSLEKVDASGCTPSTNNEDCLVGEYASTSKGDYTRAKVEYMETGPFPTYRNRRVHLMKGDGLTYIYEEHKITYEDFPLNEGGLNLRPQVFLLKKVKDRVGNVTLLTYDYNVQGRPLFTGLESPGWLGGTVRADYTFGGQKTIHIANSNAAYFINFDQMTQVSGENNISMVTTIRNPTKDNATIDFEYEVYDRYFQNAKYGTGGTARKNLSIDLKRMKQMINYNGGKRTYLYAGTDTTIHMSPVNPAEKPRSDDYYGSGRDAFYSNMLTKKSTIDGDTLSSEAFTYTYDNKGRSDSLTITVDPADDYTTQRVLTSHTQSLDNGTDSQKKTIKKYKQYPLYDEPVTVEYPDFPGHTKLESEEYYSGVSGTPFRTTYYRFNDTTVSDRYRGSFLDTAVIDSVEGIESITYTQYEHDRGPRSLSYDNPLVRVANTDPFGTKSIQTFNIYYDTSAHYEYGEFESGTTIQKRDTTFFYLINQPDSIITKSTNTRRSGGSMIGLETMIYHAANTDSGYIGQLISSRLHNNQNFSAYKETQYEYYRDDTTGAYLYGSSQKPTNEGNLKQVTDPKGNITKLYYSVVDTTTLSGGSGGDVPIAPGFKYYIVYNNDSVGTENNSSWADRRFPTITESYVDGGFYVPSYNRYDATGNTILEMGTYRYATQYFFDGMERLKIAALPYDYDTGVAMTYDTTVYDTTYYPVNITLGPYYLGYYDTKETGLNNPPVTHKLYDDFSEVLDNFAIDIDIEGGTPGETGAGDGHRDIGLMVFNIEEDDILEDLISLEHAYFEYYPTYIKTKLNGDTSASSNGDLKFKIRTLKEYGKADTLNLQFVSSGEYTMPQNDPGTACATLNYPDYYRLIDVTELIKDHIVTSGERIKGLSLDIVPVPESPPSQDIPDEEHLMWLSQCGGTFLAKWPGATINGQRQFTPKLIVKGTKRKIDSTTYKVIGAGTLEYDYADTLNKTTISAKISDGVYKKNEHVFDGFYRVKMSKLYTNPTAYDSVQAFYNYLDMSAKTIDGRDNETKIAYDKYGNADSVINMDTSYTLTGTTFQNGITTRLATVTGRVTKQVFKDEEGNRFIKYSDVVGNLVREEKFLDASISAPVSTSLYTDYLYDSLYRVTKVKTPEGKEILYEYDGYNRQSKRTTVDAGVEQYKYDINDNIRFSQNANQDNDASDLMTFRGYDGLNRVLYIGEAALSGGGDAPGGWNTLIPDSSYAIEDFSANPGNFLVINVYDSLSTAYADTFSTKKPSDYDSGTNYTMGRVVATAYRTRNTDNFGYKFYRYDKRGRVKKMWHVMDGLDTKTIDYDYNSLNQVTYLTYQYNVGGEFKKFKYAYDSAARLGDVSVFEPTAANDSTDAIGAYVNFTGYTYDPNSMLAVHKFHGNAISSSYAYNKRNWIRAKTGSKFNYLLSYYKNGNVKTQLSSGGYNDDFADKDDITMTYTYDWCNRLTSANATSHSGSEHDLTNTYDKDGNILTMQRYNSGGALADNFAYAYISGTNKLDRVTGSTAQYTYDSSGNMLSDVMNYNGEMKYDHRNLLLELKNTESVNFTFWTKYYYDEAGQRIRKQTFVNSGGGGKEGDGSGSWVLQNEMFYVRDVAGNEIALYDGTALKQWNVFGSGNEGKIDSAGKPLYYLKDHLGTIRAVVDSTNAVISGNDYDMWGYQMEGRHYATEETNYKFTGKERDNESKYDYFGARYYDSRIGRWGSIEPLLGKYISFSPYCYGLNNAVSLIDKNGRDIIFDEHSKSKIEFLNDVAVNYMHKTSTNPTEHGPLFLKMVENPEYVITDIGEGSEHLAGLTGPIRLYDKDDPTKTNFYGLGIRLFDNFFEIENKYIAALLLDHELYHMNAYTKTIKQNFGGDLKKFDEWAATPEGQKALLKHEVNAIDYSIEALGYLKANGYISLSEYNKTLASLEDYKNETKEKINED